MAIAYYGYQLSPNQTETAEGFLICRNVPIARTGTQEYFARELQMDGDPERVVTVQRYPEDVFEAAALASFEGKPVTDGHPPENVGPENYAAYSRGHIQNVRRDDEYILADLYINDGSLASDVRNGVKREVSCGYLCQYAPDGTGFKQTRIRGNHVAVVPRGRAGATVAIKDAAQEAEKGLKRMKKETKDALYRFFGMAAQDAKPEELEQVTRDVSTIATALDAVPAEAEKPAPEAEPAKDEMAEKTPKGDDIGSKLDRILEMLEAKSRGGRGERPLHDEEDIDDLLRKLAGEKGEESVTIPAEELEDRAPACNDAAVELLKKVRPAVAAIKDKTERARVVDALLSAVRGPDMVGDIMQAAQDSARKNSEESRRTTYEKICAESESAYAARNPHKNGKEK